MGDPAARTAARTFPVVAREAERARIDAFLVAVPDGARALAIRGEPGIGKTALWRHAVEQCRGAGYEVLVARPAEEETALAAGGLVDLFDRVDHDTEAIRNEDDPLARGRFVLGALRGCAERAPTVIAIDDVQWLDSISTRAVRYALRRLDAEPIGVLATARLDAGAEDPLATATALPPGRAEVLDLGPFSPGALRRVLGEAVRVISRPALHQIHEVSGGNPLYALELARALGEDLGASHSTRTLPLPGSLQAAIGGRLDGVPAKLVPLLDVASAVGRTSLGELREAMPDSDLDTLLASAMEQDILVVEESLQVRFSHPLVGAVVYARIDPLRRQELHLSLAARAVDSDVRARHLALATDDADPEVAAELERAAGRARVRGAADVAAEFAAHSLRLTPDEDPTAAHRRALLEIESLAAAGEASRAFALAERLAVRLPPGPARAEALVQRAVFEDCDCKTSEQLLLGALDEAGDDELLRGRVLEELGKTRAQCADGMDGAIACATEALALASRCNDTALQSQSSASLAHFLTLAGKPRPELMARAATLADELGSQQLRAGPRRLSIRHAYWAGDLSSARARIEVALAADVRSDAEFRSARLVYDLALVECAAGNLATAEGLVHEGVAAARDDEDTYSERLFLYARGLVEAWLGHSAAALAQAKQLMRDAARLGTRLPSIQGRQVSGLVALSEGDARRAARELEEAAAQLEGIGFEHPGVVPVLPDAIEAAAGSGDVEVAEALLARLDRQAAAVDSAWARAEAERCRGVLLLARGEAEAAASSLDRAAVTLDRLGHRPGATRAVFTRGRALLRAGQRTLAAETLADARSRFGDMGAVLWEARAAEVLERASPGRAAGELTKTESRIAALVADGRKNREIANTLFMSVATVEAHLTRIYRKLGIRSRSDLTRLVADGSVSVSAEERR